MQISQHPHVSTSFSSTNTPARIHACTDITGFGFLGHLNEMLAASPTTCVDLWIEKIPSFEGALDLLKSGLASTLARGCLKPQSLNKPGQSGERSSRR